MPSAKRSFTGHHTLLPAMRAPPTQLILIPNVMLTVMGVVIGFVISYRAMSGYDRYWMGRSAWADVIRNARTMTRLIWYHVPPRLTPFVAGDLSRPSVEEMSKVMAEKRMALDLTEAFAVALKHHLRGELGIYYEDLYNLVKPLHDVLPVPPPPAPPVVERACLIHQLFPVPLLALSPVCAEASPHITIALSSLVAARSSRLPALSRAHCPSVRFRDYACGRTSLARRRLSSPSPSLPHDAYQPSPRRLVRD
ncbi:hypothetical protein B0H10DRAFT_2239507 [Mycena sp. CBHHK59/15]|nr:hypothetical protein B0H10DRAFT_2239507 [Mycena sp. CBHHK59/15]